MSSYDAWYNRIAASTIGGYYDPYTFRDIDVALAVAEVIAESSYAEINNIGAVAVVALGGEYCRLSVTNSVAVALEWQKDPNLIMSRAVENSYMVHGGRKARRLFDLYWPAAQAITELIGGSIEDCFGAWLRIRENKEID